jgi:hypothetical protein
VSVRLESRVNLGGVVLAIVDTMVVSIGRIARSAAVNGSAFMGSAFMGSESLNVPPSVHGVRSWGQSP